MVASTALRAVGVVLQDHFLFAGTVAGNISLGDPRITAERVREAAEAVRATLGHDLIARAAAADRCHREAPFLLEVEEGRIVEGTIEWETDPDFGYSVAASVPGVDDTELLRPRMLYERQGRVEEYESMVERLVVERLEYLRAYPALVPEVVDGLMP